MMTNPPTIQPKQTKTILAVIHGSIRTTMFQYFYAQVDETEQDIMQAGLLSCAFYVTSITTMFGLSERIHGTVSGAVKDLLASVWREVDTPTPGSILIWELQHGHPHIGFYMVDEQAISNSATDKTPQQHHCTYHGTRAITQILTHDIFI